MSTTMYALNDTEAGHSIPLCGNSAVNLESQKAIFGKIKDAEKLRDMCNGIRDSGKYEVVEVQVWRVEDIEDLLARLPKE